jgi:predicted phosphodiesterase
VSRDYLAKRLADEQNIPYTEALRGSRTEALRGIQEGRHRPVVDPLAEPDRIGVCGDWHGDGVWGALVIGYATARGASAIVHLGDFGEHFHPRYLRTLDRALAVGEVPLLFVDGNHEDHRWLARQPLDERGLRRISDWVWHLPRGFRWQWAGLRFLALGGAHSVDGIWRRKEGELWQREERITDEQAAAVAAAGPADVLVAHDCPTGVPIPGIDVRGPDDPPVKFPMIELLRAAEHRQILRGVVDQVQPRAIWHGHYHVAYESYADLGYGPVCVAGLNCNRSSLPENVCVVDLDVFARQLKEAAA